MNLIQFSGSFKKALVNYYNVPEYFSSFDYALNYQIVARRLLYLFKVAVKSSPSCGLDNETKLTHFFFTMS